MKLPRLQLHLSTLLIVTLLASGVVWLNVFERTTEVFFAKTKTSDFETVRYEWGWPCTCCYQIDLTVDNREFPMVWSLSDAVINVIVCLALLAVAAVAIEWLTRRMKRGAV